MMKRMHTAEAGIKHEHVDLNMNVPTVAEMFQSETQMSRKSYQSQQETIISFNYFKFYFIVLVQKRESSDFTDTTMTETG